MQSKDLWSSYSFLRHFAVISLFIGSLVIAIWIIVSSDNESIDNKSFCYLEPSCTGTIFFDAQTGFTNDTGWALDSSGSCCQICLPGTPSTVCFNNDEDCKKKTGMGDYDYLLFDQIWIPQLCSALLQGHDPTLSHIQGMNCLEDINGVQKGLSIHGLWPNYYAGYPQCCSGSMLRALEPAEMEHWSIYPSLQTEWADPTMTNQDYYCSACYMWNHEWEKHGSCFSPGEPEEYFTAALAIAEILQDTSSLVNQFSGTVVDVETIEQLYFPYDVNVICDRKQVNESDTLGYFMEIQTCWKLLSSSPFVFEQINCPPASIAVFTEPCPNKIMVQ